MKLPFDGLRVTTTYHPEPAEALNRSCNTCHAEPAEAHALWITLRRAQGDNYMLRLAR